MSAVMGPEHISEISRLASSFLRFSNRGNTSPSGPAARGSRPNFHELGNERDPMIGAQDGTYDMTIPKRPIRRRIKGLPAFTTVKGGAYFFLPGIKALHFLAALGG